MSGEAVLLGALLLLGVPAVAVVVMYNKLVVNRQRIHESWSNVDTELKRRHDLIPNLVAAVKGYATHEREVLTLLTKARAMEGIDSNERRACERELGAAASRLFAVAEAHPDLKASESFVRLQRELATTEDRVQAARRFYNGNVRDYNTRVEQLPSAFVARAFGFEKHGYFELPSLAQRDLPSVG